MTEKMTTRQKRNHVRHSYVLSSIYGKKTMDSRDMRNSVGRVNNLMSANPNSA